MPTHQSEKITQNIFNCKYCFKNLSRKDNLNRHEKKCENKVFVFKQKGTQTKYSDTCEISSVHPNNPANISTIWVKIKTKEETYGGNVIRVKLRRLKQDIPLIILFRALNFISDKSIIELIVYSLPGNILHLSFAKLVP